jgi:hypothetical protein
MAASESLEQPMLKRFSALNTSKICVLGLLIAFNCCYTPCFAAPATVATGKSNPVSPEVKVVHLDKRFDAYILGQNMAIQVVLQTPISTEVNQIGDPIEGSVNQNIYVGTTLLIPQGTRLFGQITRLESAIEGRDGILAVRFNSILMQNSQENIAISAHVKTDEADHTWGGYATRGSKAYPSTQHAWYTGDYNRTVYGGKWKVGTHIVQAPGEFWTVVLDTPITVVKQRVQPESDEEEEEDVGHKIPVF